MNKLLHRISMEEKNKGILVILMLKIISIED